MGVDRGPQGLAGERIALRVPPDDARPDTKAPDLTGRRSSKPVALVGECACQDSAILALSRTSPYNPRRFFCSRL
jgi:hypothetical protein